MPSRKDQLHSYQFMLQRTISALVMRETDPAQSPLRRGVGAAFVAVMVTVIVAATFGIYGLLTKTGSAKWRVADAVVVEKETGASFVYLDGKLVPALNYTSALLISGKTPPTTFTVPRNSLAGVPRGLTHGIPGAPTALPAQKSALAGPWSTCAVPTKDVSGQASVETTLTAGSAAAGTPLGDLGLYVRDAIEGDEFLVWHGHRYLLSGQSVPTALFASGTGPVKVGSAWLNMLPEADSITDPSVSGRGQASSAVPRHKVGDVVVDQRITGDIDYLVLSDGLARLTSLQLDLLRASRRVTPAPLQPAEIADAPKSQKLASDSPADQQPPEQTPRLAQTSSTSGICATFGGRTATPAVLVAPDTSADPAGTPTGSRTATGAMLADLIAVRGGSVAVVRSLESGTYSLVTDVGVRYPVESADTLAILGFSAPAAVTLPTAVLNRIPTGPALTRGAAQQVGSSPGSD